MRDTTRRTVIEPAPGNQDHPVWKKCCRVRISRLYHLARCAEHSSGGIVNLRVSIPGILGCATGKQDLAVREQGGRHSCKLLVAHHARKTEPARRGVIQFSGRLGCDQDIAIGKQGGWSDYV